MPENNQEVEHLESQDTTESSPEYFDEGFDYSSLSPDLQPAYKSMQGHFTRKTQAAAESTRAAEAREQEANELLEAIQQGDPEVLKMLGYDLQDDNQEGQGEYDDYSQYIQDDEVSVLRSELETLKEAEYSRQEYEQDMQNLDNVAEDVSYELDTIEQETGQKLNARDQDWVLTRAISDAENGDGIVDVRNAYEEWAATKSEWQQEWVNSKKTPFVNGGITANHKVNMLDDNERQNYMRTLLEADA